MLIMIFMHVFDKLYASRINLNIQRLIIHTTTYKVNVLTRNIKYMRHCTLPTFPTLLQTSYFCNSQVKALIADAVCNMLIPMQCDKLISFKVISGRFLQAA